MLLVNIFILILIYIHIRRVCCSECARINLSIYLRTRIVQVKVHGFIMITHQIVKLNGVKSCENRMCHNN